MTRQYRQGDVLLCAIDAIPPTAIPVPPEGERVVVARGELTGHAHAFAASAVEMFHDAASGHAFLLIGEGGACLGHEEHDPILLPEGRYEIRRQREYTPGATPFVAD